MMSMLVSFATKLTPWPISAFNFLRALMKISQEAKKLVNELTIGSERLLVPAGSHGFRITTKISPFWNLYLNGLGFSLAEANEGNRSDRVHSYRMNNDGEALFDKTRSWRTYKESTLKEPALARRVRLLYRPTFQDFYEHIYHHRLENVVTDLAPENSNRSGSNRSHTE